MSDLPPNYGLPEEPMVRMAPTAKAKRRRDDDVPSNKSPLIAGLLSVIPGVGHLYLGKVLQGVSYLFLATSMALLVWWAETTHEFDLTRGIAPVLIILTGLFWAWVIGSAVMTAQNRRFTPTAGVLLVVLYTYLLGWEVTEVNMQKFLTEFGDTFNILQRVLWPWSAALERGEVTENAETPWYNPCPEDLAELPEQTLGEEGEPWLTVEPGCGSFAYNVIENNRISQVPGTPLTIEGGGFEPGIPLEIWIENPIGRSFRPRVQTGEVVATPDETGSFTLSFTAPPYEVPSTAVGTQTFHFQAIQVVNFSGLHVSTEFSLAANRMIVTIFQALMATTLGILFAVPVSFLAARNLMWTNVVTRLLYYVIRFILNVVRSIEPLVWAVIAVAWVGLGPFAGVIALTLHTIASLAKLYSEAIESIEPGPIEAVTATGADRLQTIVYAIIPQVIPPFLSFTIYRWDINVRMSTIIGFIGGGGIGMLLSQWINVSNWRAVGMGVWLIVITVAAMDYASGELRKRFV